FPFYRGTFHLFARDVLDGLVTPTTALVRSGAEVDLVGDAHSDNYGTFGAEDKQVHYDLNDFDETTRGAFGLDVCRLATGHFLAAQDHLDETVEQATELTLKGLRSYVETARRLLKKGKDLDLDVSEARPSGCATVDDLVRTTAQVKRAAFIERLTVWV